MKTKIILSVLGVVVAGSITSERALGQGYVTSTQLASIGGAVSRRGESNGNGFNGSVAVNGQACKGPGYVGTSRPLPAIPWPSVFDVRLQPASGVSASKAAKLKYQITNTTSSLAEVTASSKQSGSPASGDPPPNGGSGAGPCPTAGVPNISDKALANRWADLKCEFEKNPRLNSEPVRFTLMALQRDIETVQYLDKNMNDIQQRLSRGQVGLGEFKGIYNTCTTVGFKYPGCDNIRSAAVAAANMPAPNNGGLDFYYAYRGSFGYDAGPNPWEIGQPNQPMYSNRPPIIYESYVPPQTNTSGPASLTPPRLQSTYSWGDPADRPGSNSYQQWMDLKNRSYWDWRNSDAGKEQSAYLKYQYDTGANRDWLLGHQPTGWIIKWEQNLISQGALKADQTVQYSFK